MANATAKKFKPPVMTRRGGGKHTEHDAKWLGDVTAAVAAGTPNARKAAPVMYHGNPPHTEADLAPGPRPSVEEREPADVPDADDQTRHVDATPYPTTHGHHKPK
jgi:hypothetical protein